jgi:hypothetical protein
MIETIFFSLLISSCDLTFEANAKLQIQKKMFMPKKANFSFLEKIKTHFD